VNDISLLEDALRAYLNRRCRRAYAHDLRNGLQGIFGGVDALTRAARSTATGKPLHVPLEQLTTFVQQAIANHERGLERVMESIAPEQQAAAPVSCRELLIDLARFLTNDAARNNIRVRHDFHDDLKTTTVIARLRLIGLALLTDSIDALAGGGEIRVGGRTSEGRVQLEIIDTRTQPRSVSFVSEATERLVAELSGRIESKQNEGGGHSVRVELPAI
jgi:signal transduction histidine kinase